MKKKILIFLIISQIFILNIYSQETSSIVTTEMLQDKGFNSDTSEISQLKTILGTIAQVITSPIIRILATVSLIGMCLKLMITLDKKEFLKKVTGWMVICILISSTPFLLQKFFDVKENLSLLAGRGILGF